MKQRESEKKYVIILIIVAILVTLSIYGFFHYKLPSFEPLYNTLTVPFSGANLDIGVKGVIFCLPLIALFFILLCYPLYYDSNSNKITTKSKIDVKTKNRYVYSLLVVSILIVVSTYHILPFVKNKVRKTDIFENEWVDPRQVNITFPNKKKNLIFIVVESLENTFIDNNPEEREVIPNLKRLAKDNINFSNNNNIGGFTMVAGCNMTAAALVCLNSASPFINLFGLDLFKSDEVLKFKNLYSLGDVLSKEGYYLEFMLGSDSNYAGRSSFFKEHGNYYIFDTNTAKEKEYIDNDYNEWWGFEDRKLFAFARLELDRISKLDKPFLFTLLTADTHFPDGYQDKDCNSDFTSPYLNSFNCFDSLLASFLNDIANKDYYKDTAIVIVGDHLSMQRRDFEDIPFKDRKVYNAFVNSSINSTNTKNRTFTAFDLYPTILASIGANIEGDRLGFGTNLFSSTETISERLGEDKFIEELSKYSKVYHDKILDIDNINK